MAETLISPGVLARENDQSFIQGQPVEAGAAIVGPAAKGPVGIPTLVTSFSEYQAVFGGAVTSGSSEYTYLTSISANNYFSQGGESLLVTRVVSGSFQGASSDRMYNEAESGVIDTGASLSVGSGGEGGTAGSYTVTPTGSLSGEAASLTIVTSNSNGKLLGGLDALTSSITTNSSDAVDNTYSVSPSGGSGTGAVLNVVVSASAVSSITATTTGSGYAASDVLVVGSGSIGGTTDVEITLQSSDLFVEVTSTTVVSGGSGYAVGEVLSVAGGQIGSASDLSYSALGAGDVINGVPFVLTTLSEGEMMNNSGSSFSNGALASGSVDNVRWEIASRNTGSGTFSLLVRRGNDSHRNKSILETWSNL